MKVLAQWLNYCSRGFHLLATVIEPALTMLESYTISRCTQLIAEIENLGVTWCYG